MFHPARTPLTIGLDAVWLMMASKNCPGAQNLQRVTNMRCYLSAKR
jgi:hypothetical protein